MKQLDLKELTKKFGEGTCTTDELELLENWYLQWKPEPVTIDPLRLDHIMGEVWDNLPVHQGSLSLLFRSWKKVGMAAALLLTLTMGIYWSSIRYYKNFDKPILALNQIVPGGDKAVLELADGTKINVAEAQNGLLAKQAGITITKAENGQLIYNVTGDPSRITEFNSIKVPKGGKYVVCLPDGTKVWLNAESTLKYPASFASLPERKVELVGEAYFEVAHLDQPFNVHTPGQVVTDIGTKFNINAYTTNGNIKTAVVEGSVSVNKTILVAGEQAILSDKGIKRVQIDSAEVLAWKNGFFQFSNEDLKTGMSQIARWYDVEVVYENAHVKRTLNGSIARSSELATVIEILKLSGVNCKVDGRKITVLP
jgi:transmembrane sensor